MQQLQSANLESAVVYTLNDGPRVPRAYRVGFNDCESKVTHLLGHLSSLLISHRSTRMNTDRKNQKRQRTILENPCLSVFICGWFFYAAELAPRASFIADPISAGDFTT